MSNNANPYQIVIQGRLSYPQLFRPKAFSTEGDQSAAKYSASILMDKTKHADSIKKVQATIAAVAKAKWPVKLPNFKKCLRDGSEKPETDGYGDEIMFISASNTRKPQVVDRNPKNAITEDQDKVYAGCMVKAVLNLWAQDNKYGKRVNASLEIVQFIEDAPRFGAESVAAEDVLEMVGEDEENLI